MRRLGRVLKWAAIVVAVVIAFALVVNAFFVWSTGASLERRLTQLREDGYPVQIADLAHAPVAPEKNAYTYLRKVRMELEACQTDLLTVYPRKGYVTGILSAEEQAPLEKLFAKHATIIPLIEQAASCPDVDPQFDLRPPTTRFLQAYMDQTSNHRMISRVLRARCSLLLSQGRRDEALTNQIVLLRLTRLWRSEPLIIAYLVTSVCELGAMEGINDVLQSGPVSAPAREALDTELALHDTMEGYDRALVTERAYALSSCREIPGARWWLLRGLQNNLALGLIELFDRYRQKSSRLYAEVTHDEKVAPAVTRKVTVYGPLITLLEPALISLREPAERTRAMCRAIRVLNALQARAGPTGTELPDLTHLGLPEHATIDPFDGKPLRVKKLSNGWMVYSVGGNLVDDSGILDLKTDVGAGPSVVKDAQPKK
jgi:hypothetical protein